MFLLFSWFTTQIWFFCFLELFFKSVLRCTILSPTPFGEPFCEFAFSALSLDLERAKAPPQTRLKQLLSASAVPGTGDTYCWIGGWSS